MDTCLKLAPDKICRTCLCKSSNMRLLSSRIDGEHRTLLDVLTFVVSCTIKTGIELPEHICNSCETILCKADAFKRRYLEAESILNRFNITNEEAYFVSDKFKNSHVKYEESFESKSITEQLPCNIVDNPPAAEINLYSLLPQKYEEVPIFDTTLSSATSDTHLNSPCKEDEIQIIKLEATENDDLSEVSIEFDDHTDTYEEKPKVNKQIKGTKSESTVYSCSCGIIFNKKVDYKTHFKINNCGGSKNSMKIKTEKKNEIGGSNISLKRKVSCPECNLTFDTVKSCKIHQRKHKLNDIVDKDYECSMCMRKFSRKSSYTNHLKHHNEKANVRYTCESCKREFQHKAHLDNHILAVHTTDKGFMCELCSANFSTQKSLDTHKESHKIEKKHQCTQCSKSFIMLSTLNDHMRTHTGEKPFLCSECGKGFSQKTNLAQHMRRHQGLKPFKCKDCDRRFVSKGELDAHTRKHSGAHPFLCVDCGSGFTTSSSLVKHRRIHTGERPYACDLCSMRFAASGTLKNHRRTHTGEKPFQCSYCEKAFVQRHDLISHIRCHTGERPYTCGCGQSFRKSSALKTHVKMHGKEPLQREGTVLQGVNNMLINDFVQTPDKAVLKFL